MNDNVMKLLFPLTEQNSEKITVPEKGNQRGTKRELFQICCPATDLSKFIG